MNITSPSSRGFTIIELLVAAAVTIIMMVLIGQLFTSTTAAVSQGASRSDIIAKSDAFTSQINLDAEAMVGPHADADGNLLGGGDPEASGGILIIVNKVVGNWTTVNFNATTGAPILDGDSDGDGIINPRDGESGTEGVVFPMPGQGGEARRFVRSDQLAFITQRRSNDNPLCPGYDTTFEAPDDGGYTSATGAKYKRVWYGHALRTNSDGSSGASTEQLGGSQDPIATNWFLARQAMFLGEQDSTTLPAFAYAVSGASDALIQNDIGGPPSTALRVANGLIDYAVFSFDNYTVLPSIVGKDASGTDPDSLRLHSALAGAWAATAPYDDYRQRAIAWYTFPYHRLRVDPVPPSSPPLAWQIAQMHPALSENCSDFIVEWAGDLYTGDNYSATTISPDGQIDVTSTIDESAANGFGVSLPAGSIRWYSHYRNDPNAAYIATFDSRLPVVFKPATGLPAYCNGTGAWTAALCTEIDGAFVWQHDDEDGHETGTPTPQPSYWPYLIRIRYRLHDPRGQLMSGDTGVENALSSHGVWFEHILRVNRP